MKKALLGSAFVLAICAVFAFKSDTTTARTMKLANQNVYNAFLDPCEIPRLCSNNAALPACLKDDQNQPVVMYDDIHSCQVVSQFQFIPE